MKIQIKSVLTAIVVVIMVATGLSLSAAAILDHGKKEVKSKNVAPTNGWYVITIPSGDPALETNQVIGSLTTTPPVSDDLGCAQSGNSGDVCMVQLSFEPSATTVPATVAAARLAGSLTTVGIKAQSPEN